MSLFGPRLVFFISCILISFSLNAADQESPQSLIDTVLTAYGGGSLWGKTVGVEQAGQIHSTRRDAMGLVKRSYRYPNHMQIDIQYSSKDKESRRLEGDAAWKNDQPASVPYMLATRLQAARILIPRLLLEKRQAVRGLESVVDAEGKQRRLLQIPLEQGLELVLDIDPSTGRILRSRGRMRMGEQLLEFAAVYDDFRTEAGRLIPFKEHHYAMGGYIGYTQLERSTFIEAD